MRNLGYPWRVVEIAGGRYLAYPTSSPCGGCYFWWEVGGWTHCGNPYGRVDDDVKRYEHCVAELRPEGEQFDVVFCPVAGEFASKVLASTPRAQAEKGGRE